jgi:hypothetical protein
MINHIRNELLNRGNRYLQVVALIAVASVANSALSGCSGDRAKDEDPSQAGSGDQAAQDVGDCPRGDSDWDDPGTVPNPQVVAVAADAGQKGHVFGRSGGLADYDYEEGIEQAKSAPIPT